MEHARPPAELNMDAAGGPVSRADAWRRWRQQFTLFVKASGVHSESPAVQASLLVNLIGPEGFDIYQTFSFEKESDRDDIQNLIQKYDNYFGTKVNITLLRYKFFTRNQENDETIQQYVTALRLLSKHCKFDKLENELIKDRIVCGVQSSTIRDRLLRCDDLDLDKAVKICQAEEVSRESGQQIGGTSAAQVDGVNRRYSVGRPTSMAWRGGCAAPSSASGAMRALSSGERPARGRGARRPVAVAAPRAACTACGGLRCVQGRCPARHVTCFVCGKSGHFARVCNLNSYNNNVKQVQCVDEINNNNGESSSDEGSFFVSIVENQQMNGSGEWCETFLCGNGAEKFKLDTGADINVMSYDTFSSLGFKSSIIKCKRIKLQSYTGDTIPVKGVCNLVCSFKNVHYNLKFAIADIKCQSVLGRKSCEEIGLIKRINTIHLTEYEDLFKGLGCLPGKYHIVVDESVRPVVCASRKIPLGLRDRLAEELRKMEKLGVIRKVSHPTAWVHPLVLVAKKNNSIRICLDPRELNRAVQRAHFQLPTVTELASRLKGAKYFSVLDANAGFWAICLDDASADLCTFATPFGRYQFLRLPFGINCASEVFHGKIRQLLEDLEGTDSFIDDIIVWGRTKQEHDLRLDALLKRARKINLKFNKNKCRLGVEEVTYLGHVFDKNGMRPDINKVKAIKEMVEPNDRKGLERFLGAVNYLSKFIPNYSEFALPLTRLLRRDSEWQWEVNERKAFEALKKSVCCAPVLALYDVSQPVLLSVDSSRDALGAVLMQAGRPIEYASRTLTDTQRRYAQIEKELLAIVFACERFHQYIYGKHKVVVESDHKPLESIFKKPLMSVPARLQRMMLRIQSYDLVVCYKPGKYMYLPDTLSRAPLPELYSEEVEQNVLYQVQLVINSLPISNKKLSVIKNETNVDEQLKKMHNYIQSGWPDHKHCVDEDLREYWHMKEELFVVDGVIFKNDVIVIPRCLRTEMLRIVHEGHQGIERCKRRARQVMFWPNMSRDIEKYVKRCSVCQENSNIPSREPLIPVEIPMLPWHKVGSDIFEYNRRYFLLIVDYYSNYVEVCPVKNITSKTIIQNMKEVFARHGIPEILISDNGTQYTSREFRQFAKEWGFEQVTSSPNYPQSNGKSERDVQTIKSLLIKSIKGNGDFQLSLLNYRNTPREGLSSPAQLLMSRMLRCKLPITYAKLKPKVVKDSEYSEMLRKQSNSKNHYDMHCKRLPTLDTGDKVICVDGKTRSRGVVIGHASTPRSYVIENRLGNRYRRNRRHLIKCEDNENVYINDGSESNGGVKHAANKHDSTDGESGTYSYGAKDSTEPIEITTKNTDVTRYDHVDHSISPESATPVLPHPLTRAQAKKLNLSKINYTSH